jgi:hypothetical protein
MVQSVATKIPRIGMLDDAYENCDRQRAFEEQQRQRSDDFAARQHREIAEFISVMKKLGVAPRQYACFEYANAYQTRK